MKPGTVVPLRPRSEIANMDDGSEHSAKSLGTWLVAIVLLGLACCVGAVFL